MEQQVAQCHMRAIGHYARRPNYRICKQMLFAKCVPNAQGAPRQAPQIITTYRDCLQQHGVLPDFLAKAQARATWRGVIAKGAQHTS